MQQESREKVRMELLSNVFSQLSIFSFVLADRTFAPGVKATFGNSKDLAHNHNGKFMFVSFNALRLHLLSREKMLTAFFPMSRSC